MLYEEQRDQLRVVNKMKRRHKDYITEAFKYRKVYKGLSCQWDPTCFI